MDCEYMKEEFNKLYNKITNKLIEPELTIIMAYLDEFEHKFGLETYNKDSDEVGKDILKQISKTHPKLKKDCKKVRLRFRK